MKQGLSIHCHHDILLEYCYDYDERVKAIKRNKPKNEQKIRLRLFKLLPQEAINDLPEGLVKASANRQKAYAEWEKADAEWQKAYVEWYKASANRQKADTERQKAYANLDKADANRQKADTERPNKEAWHKKWCGCAEWNGKEIRFY